MAATWKFSDGTMLEFGGRVTGVGPLADSLRIGLAGVASGISLSVSMWPEPGGSAQLDPNNVATMDVWARGVADRRDVTLVEGPTYDYPPDPRGELPPSEPGEIN